MLKDNKKTNASLQATTKKTTDVSQLIDKIAKT